ncbi:MAG: glycoside hydrolase family 127 protein [Bacteroidales bacterium]|nr:glycoside hydrolase family 127 protein [Bacteroidales bacterium]MBN2761598.1 glycoside hydrolase family 127 protein [Bacteroidales bacterium]
MKTINKLLILLLFLTGFFASCKTETENRIKTTGPEVVDFGVLPFEITDVKLLDGPFKKATELNVKSLLNYEPDRMLAKFRSEAGLMPKAEHYGGWEGMTIAGHSLGHYLSACALMYQTTGDQRFLERVNTIVAELDTCQQADEDGYIGAFPDGKRILEEEVAKGNIRSAGFDLNGIWVPYYTQHKVMAGLNDAYHLCGNEKALEIEKKFANWLERIVIHLPDSSVQKMLHCEHGGINEALAQLYGDTGNEKYLKMSRIFHHKAILDSLLTGKDILPEKHANTQIPKLIGLARRYELTGDLDDRKTAEFFWDRVAYHHSYVTGGNGNNEYFGQPDKLRNRLGPNTTETCNVYNMLKLTRHLFLWEPTAEKADFYERALLNHILSSQHPGDGRVIYNLSLDMGGRKEYQDPYWFTCCIGTGMENHSKYGANIYYYNNDDLYVSQLIASEVNWKNKSVMVRQETAYPEEQGTSIFFDCQEPVKFTLQIRYPYWAEQGISIAVNGKKQRINQEPGSFIPIKRTWNTGDKVEVNIPFSLRLETMPDDSNRIAVFYGPLVLAGELGPDQDSAVHNPLYVPVLMTGNRNPAEWTDPVPEKVNEFMTKDVGKPHDVLLRPFYAMHERHYSVYWDMFTEDDWNKRADEYKAHMARVKELQMMTVDFVQPGEMQPERDHNFKGEKTEPYYFKERAFRESRSGWFSYDMKVLPDQAMALVVDYWGGFPGSKTFDILIDDNTIATENISNKKDGQFISPEYEIPEKLTRGKTKITVKFQAHPKNMAGPVFGVRTIKKSKP